MTIYTHSSPVDGMRCKDLNKLILASVFSVQLTMFIQESLRLYGPGVTTAREVLAEMKLGEHVLLKGINMWLYLPAILQRDTDNWGPDAREFKLERLAGGVSAACKYPQAYIPFGLGS